MKKKSGFTIVEVSLVLAIGGLILAMVFVALPALRRSQRDAERREDVLLLLEKVKEYQQSNRGALPNGTGWTNFYNDYLGEGKFNDPDGEKYELSVIACDGSSDTCSDNTISEVNKLGQPIVCSEGDESCSDNVASGDGGPNRYTILIVTQATCDGQNVKASSNPRRIAAFYKLEAGGLFCGNT